MVFTEQNMLTYYLASQRFTYEITNIEWSLFKIYSRSYRRKKLIYINIFPFSHFTNARITY